MTSPRASTTVTSGYGAVARGDLHERSPTKASAGAVFFGAGRMGCLSAIGKLHFFGCSSARLCSSVRPGMPQLANFRAAVLLALTLLIFAPDVALGEKRVALVIGNGDYLHAPRLPNPTRDATAIAEMFKRVGFEIV